MATSTAKPPAILDTVVRIESPPDPNVQANLDATGELDPDAEWTTEGRARIRIGPGSSTTSAIGGQAGDVTTFNVEMNKREFSLDWRLQVLSGPYKDYTLWPLAIGATEARTRRLVLVCSMVRTV